LSESLVEGPQERYQLNWPGKREALLTANAPIAKTLRPCREESVDFDTTKNLFIEGDNLDALKLLQETYLGKVKMIYIDPPYNTGKDFIYRDRFTVTEDNYLSQSGDKDEDGNRLVANQVSSGRYHSDWLSMLYPRIKLARNLLGEDGLMFISIGEDEIANLTKICDEVFGKDNFIAHFIWNTDGHTDNQFDVKVNHEYILLYSKSSQASLAPIVDPNTRSESNLWRGYAENSITKNGSANPPSELTLPRGFPCKTKALQLSPNTPDIKFFEKCYTVGYITREITKEYDISYPIRLDDIIVEEGVLANPCRVFSGWANADKLRQFILSGCNPIDEGDGNVLSFYLSDRGVIYYRRDRDKAKNIVSVLRNMGTTEQMRSELEKLGIPFQYPKPKQLLKYIISTGLSRPGIVMDFFAGSGTAAHALLEYCASEGLTGSSYILCQFPEQLRETDANQKPGYEFCIREGKAPNIAEICKERIRRVGKVISSGEINESWDGDVGFRVLKIDTSNMADVYYTPDAVTQEGLFTAVDNIKPDRSAFDLLFQVMLDWGVDLALPIEKKAIQGKDVYLVDGNAMAACFDNAGGIDDAFAKELATIQPLRAVFRDAGFKDSTVKINIEQIFKLLSPATEVKCL
jgi:adenine-specific DNA-methyltransferase